MGLDKIFKFLGGFLNPGGQAASQPPQNPTKHINKHFLLPFLAINKLTMSTKCPSQKRKFVSIDQCSPVHAAYLQQRAYAAIESVFVFLKFWYKPQTEWTPRIKWIKLGWEWDFNFNTNQRKYRVRAWLLTPFKAKLNSVVTNRYSPRRQEAIPFEM